MNRKLRISRFAGEFGRIVKILSRYLKHVPLGNLGREGMVKPSPGRAQPACRFASRQRPARRWFTRSSSPRQ